MNKQKVFLLFFFYLIYDTVEGIIPHPDHVVVVVLENHSYSQIVGSPAAPYINNLINDSKTALFTQSFGLTRPSQPNYLQLFSGSTQGVTNNLIPGGIPFVTPNLGASLIGASKTFIGYSEGLPSVGFTGETSGLYVRKHNPWVNWQGSSVNEIPAILNQPFTAFPTNFNLLPSVSFVVPDLVNGMHDGTDPTRITTGDMWIQTNLNSYIQWAKTNNSLLILTFDEGDPLLNQHILTLIVGEDVQPGSYSNPIDHYNVLRLIEDMFNLPHSGAASTAATIDYCWTSCNQPVTISSNGPLTFCQGNSVSLTASAGVSYLWSNGATTQSIIVSTSGSYSVSITDALNCTSSPAPALVSVNSFLSEGTLFNETMGTVTVNSSIATHEANNGFVNDNLTMSGTAEVRASAPSYGYPEASTAGNFFLTNTSGRNAIISGINTSGLSNFQLSFGIFKSTTASTGSDLLVQVSSDGISYTTLSYASLPSGTGTAIWYYRTASGSIPATSNLRIRFMQNGTTTLYRIDDVSLKYSITTPLITAGESTTFCQGGNVSLNASIANSYSWSNGATSQNITVSTSGNYYVIQTGSNGCTASSNTISINVNQAPTIVNFSPVTAPVGSNVIIYGTGFNSVYSVLFNGINASFSVNSDIQLTAIVPAGFVSGVITLTNNFCSAVSTSAFIVLPGTPVLNLKLFIEGYYSGSGTMLPVLSPGVCDSITLELHNSTFPYSTFYIVKSVISTSGNGTFELNGSLFGKSFYLVASNHNSINTWSSSTVLFNMSNSYDFTTSASMAFGNNMKNLGDGKFAFYSGDITRDGQINSDDINEVKNHSQLFLTGYLKADLNGDKIVESSDLSLIENNSIPVIGLHP